MKFRRATLFRTATAMLGATALATTLAVTTLPGSAKAADGGFTLCNYLYNTGNAIDVWNGSTFLGKAWHDQCAWIPVYAGEGQVDFYLDNTGIWLHEANGDRLDAFVNEEEFYGNYQQLQLHIYYNCLYYGC